MTARLHFFQFMRVPGWWQFRIWLPNHTLRLICERKSDVPGWIKGGWGGITRW